MSRDFTTNHQKALVLGGSIGTTIAASMFAALLAPGTDVQLETSLILFLAAISVFLISGMYGAARVFFHLVTRGVNSPN